MWIAADGPGW
jgi:hypothetical protein